MATEQAGDATAGVWQTLSRQVAFSNYVPVPVAPELIEERAFVHRSGEPYHVLKQRERRTYLSLPPDAYALWQMMDGSASIRSIAVRFALEHKRMVVGLLRGMVDELRAKGFLRDPPARVFERLAARRERRSPAHWLRTAFESVISRNLVVFRGGDAALGAMYRAFGWVFFTRPAQVLLWATLLGGLAAWLALVARGGHSLIKLGDSYLAAFVLLFLFDALAITAHELGHAFAVKHQGREVIAVGVLLYYGTPCAYVNTTDIWMSDRKARIVASWAGPFVSLVLAGLLGLVALVQPADSLAGDLAFKGASVWFIGGFLQFIPLLELDGYFMLVDLLEMPLIRARSFEFLRRSLWRKLRGREAWSQEERILGVFGVAAALFSLVMLGLTLWGWNLRGASIARELWELPAWYGKPLLGLLVLLFGGPLLLGLGTLLVQTVDRVRRAAFGRLDEQRLASRAAPVLAALPYLRQLPPGERLALAQHCRPRRFAAGAAVVRQGEPPDGFYFIRAGEALVERAAPGAAVERVALLGPGDYFGELAYLNRAPRNATVRAQTALELYYLDGGHFRRWLEDGLQDRAEVKQRMVDHQMLQRFDLFRGLSPIERSILLEHVGLERFAAGEVVFSQGMPGEKLYLIGRGSFEVLVREAAEPPEAVGRPVATLGAGELFGEIALLDDRPRTATVRALEPALCFTLDRVGLGGLFEATPANRSRLDRLALERLRETRAGFGAVVSRAGG